jgi:hypothetical protein
MSYFEEIDDWLSDILTFDPDVDGTEEKWFERVKKEIKDRLLEFYRNGQKAGGKAERQHEKRNLGRPFLSFAKASVNRRHEGKQRDYPLFFFFFGSHPPLRRKVREVPPINSRWQ